MHFGNTCRQMPGRYPVITKLHYLSMKNLKKLSRAEMKNVTGGK